MANQAAHKEKRSSASIAWAARIAVLAVFVINVSCAFLFITQPGNYVGAYQLEGVPGTVAIQGIGVAFAMWNCTYPLVIINPRRNMKMYAVVLVQQALGIVGEFIIRLGLPLGYDTLAHSIERFLLFDAAGLVLMLAMFIWLAWAMWREKRTAKKKAKAEARAKREAERAQAQAEEQVQSAPTPDALNPGESLDPIEGELEVLPTPQLPGGQPEQTYEP